MNTMTAERPRYLAYLLRLWCVDTNGETVWHASVEDPHTGERHGFANLARLFEFLQGRTHDSTRNKADGVDADLGSDHRCEAE